MAILLQLYHKYVVCIYLSFFFSWPPLLLAPGQFATFHFWNDRSPCTALEQAEEEAAINDVIYSFIVFLDSVVLGFQKKTGFPFHKISQLILVLQLLMWVR